MTLKDVYMQERKEKKIEKSDLLQIFAAAKKLYTSEDRKSGKISHLGLEFGFFSSIRHGKPPAALEDDLTKCQTVTEAKFLISEYLKSRVGKDHTHSFSRYLLKQLKDYDPTLCDELQKHEFSIRYAFNQAVIKFNTDSWKVGDTSSIGCEFVYGEKKDESQLTQFETSVIKTSSTKEADETAVIAILLEQGSLWDPRKGQTLSFTNYFLTCLRIENIADYKTIVGKAYGITFIPNDRLIKLYRRDTREYWTIFSQGFQLLEECNYPSCRKSNHLGPFTSKYGVSFSKGNPPSSFGDNCYEISLPIGHQLLIIDIVNSPCHKGKLDDERLSLKEANSLDPMPHQYVFSCTWSSGFETNGRFSSKPIDEARTRKFRGCF